MTLQSKTIALVVKRIREDQQRYKASEAETRTGLINPVLQAYGWKLNDPSQVRAEQGTGQPGRPDLTLVDPERKAPVAQLEAKKLASPELPKAVQQVAQYNDGGGRTNRLNIITDGDKWIFRRPGSGDDEKPLAEVQLSQDHPKDAASTLTKVLRPQRIRTGRMDQVMNTMTGGEEAAPDINSNTYVSVDLETTGFSPRTDRIIEVGAVKFQSGVEVDSLRFLVNPNKRIPAPVQELTGITNEDVANAPQWNQVRAKLADFIGGCPIIAHNAAFDRRMLDAHGITTTDDWYDTMKLSRRVHPDAPSHSLENITKSLGIYQPGNHRADHDARLTAKAFTLMMSKANNLTPEKRASLVRETHRRAQAPESKLLLASGPTPRRHAAQPRPEPNPRKPIHSRVKTLIKPK